MRVLRLAVAVGVTAVGLMGGAGPAGACSIVGPIPPEPQLIDQADLVFDGVALASQDPNTTATVVSSADPITWTFTVEEVVKGTASGTQQVATARDGASCGFSFVVGHHYRVFADATATGFSTTLFSGTRELTVDDTTATTEAPTNGPPEPVPTTGARAPLARTGFPVAAIVTAALGLVVGGWLLTRRRPDRGESR